MILNILNIHNVYGCSQLHLIWLANHSGLVQKAAGDLEPGQTRYGWWQRGWGELFYCHRQCLPKTLKTMPKTLKTKTTPKTLKCPIKQQFKATTLLGSRPVYCNCLLDFSIRVPQIPPTDSTPPGAFAASVNGFMFVQAFKSEACVSSWDSLFLILITYDYQSIPPSDLPESLVLHLHWNATAFHLHDSPISLFLPLPM